MSTDVPGSSPVSTEAASSPASPAAPAAPASSSPAPASSAPASEPTAAASSTEQSVPYGRFKEVNDQLRAARDFQSKYEALKWAESFQQDPYVFVENWLDQLAGHPQFQQQIYAKAARMLQSRRGQGASEEPAPDVPIQDANGNIVGQTYSATQLKKWQDWNWQQREAAFSERLQPLERQVQSYELQRQEAQLRGEAAEWAKNTFAELERDDPNFKEHKQAALQALAEHEEWGDDIHRAYNYVLRTKVLPTIRTTTEQTVLDTLKTQAAGGTVAPNSASPTKAPKFKDFGEAIRYYDAHPEEAAAMAKR